MLTYYFNLRRITHPLNEYSQLEEMLALRALGHSYQVLADRFKVPKLTIRYLCRRFGLAHNIQVLVVRLPSATTSDVSSKYNYKKEKINPGKTYAQYLEEDRKRKWERLTHSKE